ncbi:ATP synthase subunit C family protein [Tritrichomonas foetus]|uniref:ATP synthase subunit C family protein n=1 Tax=Tritrichomonas foetus TaxID=1144522 RepID=A0A1J4JEK8_9EUKA|nr:ATP synthase subunit C family protein [Tritrichomonas foetus]|eukprot:OHS97630.1 ATP synthase subunit C family protein [Tritrichomonas foetus]
MVFLYDLNPYNFAGEGIGLCVGLAACGAAWGIWSCGTAMAGTAVISGRIAMRDIMNLILCEVIAIYGLIMALVLNGRMVYYPPPFDRNHYHAGYAIFFGGIVQGLCSFSAGLAIGIMGATISVVCHRDADMFFKLLIVQIFSELIGIMGLLVCLLMSMRAKFQPTDYTS